MGWLNRLSNLVIKRDLNVEIDEELRFHLEARIHDNVAAGMTEGEARRDAFRRFGSRSGVRESVRDANILRHVEGWVRDLKYALRRLRATPAFTIFAVVSLALGLGVTTTVYSIIRAVCGPPPGVHDSASIVNVYQTLNPNGSAFVLGTLSWPDYQDLKARQTTFEHLTGWSFFRQAMVVNGHAETAFGELVGGEYFQTLGVDPALGRMIQPADDTVGAPPVAVISYGVWQRVFGGEPDVVGRLIKMNGHGFQIVGVAPSTFRGLFNNGFVPSGLWVPLVSVPLLPSEGTTFSIDPTNRERRWLMVKGRLRPGRTEAEAQTDVTNIARQLDAAYPVSHDSRPPFEASGRAGRPWGVRRADDVIINENADRIMRPLVAALVTAVVLVLLVACTNLANLMLARGSGRSHEAAVRLALGASRWRLIRESLAESAILAGAGGVLGLVVARLLLTAIGTDLNVTGSVALHVEPTIDAFVTLGAAAATLLALVVAGLVPAIQTTRSDVRSRLASGGSGALLRWRGRRVLIAAQIVVSLVLLSLTAVSVDVVRRDSRNDTGIDLEHLALAQVDFSLQQYDKARVPDIVAAVLDHLAKQAGVTAVAASSGLPLGVSTPAGAVRSLETAGVSRVEALASTPGIFRTLGVSILRGRSLDDRDTSSAQPVVVLSEYAAKELFGTVDVVGRPLIYKRAPWVGMPPPIEEAVTIVGVASDTDTGVAGRRDHGTVYLSLAQHYEGRLVLAARTDDDPSALVGVLRQSLAFVDPELAVVVSGTGLAVAAPANLFLEVVAGIAGTLGGFSLILALAGLYGALSQVVARRTREIGVRLALGATAAQIVRMVLRDGLRPAIFGIAVGVALSVVVRLVTPYLVFVRLLPAFDPLVLVIAPLTMLVAAFIACYVPARRAARVDPNAALKDA